MKPSDFKEQPTISKDKRSLVEIVEGDLTDNVTIYVRPTFEKSITVLLPQPLCIGPIIMVVIVVVASVYYMRVRKRRALEKAHQRPRHQAHPHHVQGRRPQARPEVLDKYGENLEGMKRLQPHVHKYQLPLKTWKHDDGTEDEELPVPRKPQRGAHITATPPPTAPGKASVPLSQPKPYLTAKPTAPVQPKHITAQPEKFVKCPSCGRRFGIHPEQETLECPHCGKIGKAGPKKPHITGVPPAQAAHSSRSIKCPRCGKPIVYSEEQEVIRCGQCGKEGRVKKKH